MRDGALGNVPAATQGLGQGVRPEMSLAATQAWNNIPPFVYVSGFWHRRGGVLGGVATGFPDGRAKETSWP